MCITTQIDWNYYLERRDNSHDIYYEGYKTTQWTKEGDEWITSDRFDLFGSKVYICKTRRLL